LAATEGEVVDESGRRLGTHQGHWAFTPGQRRGIGVAAGKPLHVIRTDPERNRVVVGERAALARSEVHVRGGLFCPVDRAEAKLRYRTPAIPATVQPVGDGFSLTLDEPAYGVAPGQAAVLYEDDAVVGAGIIEG
jgi:tRNA-specific 2-thiouridylase